MLRNLFSRASLFALITIVLPGIAASQGLVRVYVGQDDGGGFTSGADVGDSELDLIKELRHKDTISVVHSVADADAVVHVTNRHHEKSVGSFTTFENRDVWDGKSTSTTYANQKTERVVLAELVVDEFKLELEGRSITWGGAADEIADDIEDWAHDNYARLLDRRAHLGMPDTIESAAGASEPMEEAAIETGMTPEQVEDIMGQPVKEVTFGTQTLWDYNGFQIVFSNDKVSDVKF